MVDNIWGRLIALFRPRFGAQTFSKIEHRFALIAKSKHGALLAAALFPLIARGLMLPWYPPPAPQIHDEFSYLLQADTFAHGRLSNPTPPYWRHFETEYVLLQPTYSSQYQPAQGLMLAFGQIVFGHPWFGVWISVGIMSAAICWALRYLLPPVWALFGAMLAVLQFGIFGLWMNSYFGGALSAAAGALVLGSLLRTRIPDQRTSSGALCALGLILLFATRPVEGLMWSAVAAVYGGSSSARVAGTPILAFTAVFMIGSCSLAWYNFRVTGNPLNPPYLEYRRVYGTPQPFWWQTPLSLINTFTFPELRDNYLFQVHLYNARYSGASIFKSEPEASA